MTRRLEIWLVTIGEPLPIENDSRPLRTRLLARELASRGASVRWWTSNFNHFAKRHHPLGPDDLASEEGYLLSLLKGRSYSRNLSIDRQINHIEIARDFSIRAKFAPSPDAIVCSFPSIELAWVVSNYAHRSGVPLVMDIRDLWPDEMVRRAPQGTEWLARLVTSPLAWLVSRAFSNASAIVAVSQEYLDWAVARTGRGPSPRDRLIPLGYPDSPVTQAMRAAPRPAIDGSCKFFFSGSFNQSVDLGCFLEAFRGLPGSGYSAVLCGDGENFGRWRAYAANDKRVTFPGWCTQEGILHHARNADVGLVCYRPESLVLMPNKLFEYMSFGLPMVNSIQGEAAQLINDHSIGINYAAGSVEHLRATLRRIGEDHTLRIKSANNAARLYEQRFRASDLVAQYADYVEQIARQSKSALDAPRGFEPR